MTTIRQDLLQSQPRENYSNALARFYSPQQLKQSAAAAPAIETQTEQAVQAVGDSASLRPNAQAIADIKSVIDQLNQATSPDAVVEALNAVKTLVQNNSAAGLIGDALGELSSLADTVLGAVAKDPSALGSGFAFHFQGNFQQQTQNSENFYQNISSFSFSFSYQDDQTKLQANLSFDEKLSISDTQLKYESRQQVKVHLVTFNIDQNTNPALKAFVDLTQKLSGIDLSSALGAPSAKPASSRANGPYVVQDFLERLQLHLKELTDLSTSQKALIDLLGRLAPPADDQSTSPAVVSSGA